VITQAEVVDLPVGTSTGSSSSTSRASACTRAWSDIATPSGKAQRRNKWVAMFVAMARALVDFPIVRVTLTTGGRSFRRSTPSVIVCNNAHQMEAFGVDGASYADRRKLNVYVAGDRGRWPLVWLMIRAMFGRLSRRRTSK
jgi:diacylglycerol kinase family enzyme